MRSPILAFSLFAAAAVSVSAQSNIAPGLPLSPDVQGNAGSFRVNTPREHRTTGYPEQSNDGSRSLEGPDNRRPPTRPAPPEPPHFGADHGGIMVPHPADDLNGGMSNSAPAVGATAGDGGGSMTTTDGDPASGADLVNIGNQIFDTATGKAPTQSDASNQDGSFSYDSAPGYAYGYHRMRRVVRTLFGRSAGRRDDPLQALPDGGVSGLPNQQIDDNNNNNNDNSGQDGPDGVSQRGNERDGRGPNGGHAHSGQVGSSEGGHVYNIPASD
ncbi:hypothetical protein OH77DRAFT_1418075 [Trametes cingulata]|nr:hypothetical protein OH77DRAFT_1418075 [Trametes cingulata]